MFFIFVLFNIFLLMDVGDLYNCYKGLENEKNKLLSTCDTESEEVKTNPDLKGITDIKCAHLSCVNGVHFKACGYCKVDSVILEGVKCKCYECTSELCNSVIISQFNWRIIFGLLFICIGALSF
ncbi:hypothetical protein Mgra_00009732 [Meloidogyne graminicola]|uniref:Protein sleepless n=1 Tax=Meloidogyne graminicola TaxID=189291 RepID=A0A8S9ZBV7_9BILA|nr:hypothetical protein Mgra_00009732 [Meloidogyne graminicola]